MNVMKERIFDKDKMSNVKKANQYFVDLPNLLANDLLVKMTKKMFEAHYLINLNIYIYQKFSFTS